MSGNNAEENTCRNDNANNEGTYNATTNVVNEEDLPQLLDSREGSHVINVPQLDVEDFSSWNDREMWNDLILSHEEPSETRDTKIATLRLKFNAFKGLKGEKVQQTYTRLKILLNELENKNVKIPQVEVNATFMNNSTWLSMNQTKKANNSIKNDNLATIFGKYNYEVDLIDEINESETKRFTIQSSSSKALISNSYFHDSDSYVEEDTRSSKEFFADLNLEFHDRALFANQKDAIKEDEGTTIVKAFMAIDEDEPTVGKTDARSVQNLTLQHEATKLNLANKSLKDEISDLKKVMETNKVSLDQLLNEQVPSNIVHALGGRGKQKDNNSSKGTKPLSQLA
ncbi:hypothetical protein Tco_0976899 [Tanacetum coccineum]|uniref:Uncharacterized protein n=1 Tax=Tanacetum coccineum TaxID=301880 RepID=A0ABQ5EJP8_9ASTR